MVLVIGTPSGSLLALQATGTYGLTDVPLCGLWGVMNVRVRKTTRAGPPLTMRDLPAWHYG